MTTTRKDAGYRQPAGKSIERRERGERRFVDEKLAAMTTSIGGPAVETHRLRRVTRNLAWTLFGVALFLGLLTLATRLVLPMVKHYRTQVESLVSRQLGRPVTIGKVNGGWEGWTPRIELQDVSLLDQQDGRIDAKGAVGFQRASFGVDLLASAEAGSIRFGPISIAGVSLKVRRSADGGIELLGIGRDVGMPNPENQVAVLGWLMSQPRLELESATVDWLEFAGTQPAFRLVDANVRLENDAEQHLVSGNAKFADRPAGRVDFSVDANGDMTSGDWNGEVRLTAIGMDPAALGTAVIGHLPRIEGERADVTLVSRWRGGELAHIDGNLSVEALEVTPADGATLRLARAAAELSVQRTGKRWTLELTRVALAATAAEPWPTTRIAVSLEPRSDNNAERQSGMAVSAEFDRVRLEHLASLEAVFPPAVGRSIAIARPVGELRQVSLDLWSSAPQTSIRAKAQLYDVGLSLTGDGQNDSGARIAGISGALTIDPGGGSLALDAGPIRVDAAALLTHPLDTRVGTARVDWTHSNGRWRAETEHLVLGEGSRQAAFSGAAEWSREGPPPYLDLAVKVPELELEQVVRELPHPALNNRLNKWLLRALSTGSLRDLNLTLRGRLDEFPFDDGSGVFEARAQIAGAELAFHPKWPAVKALDGELVFVGRGLTIKGTGTIRGARITATTASIDNLAAKPPVLKIDGRVDTTLDNGFAFLRDGPLAARFATPLRSLAGAGKAAIELDLAIPLRKGTPNDVRGNVKLTDASLSDSRLGMALDAVSGAVEISDRGLSAPALAARYRGQPVSFSVQSSGKAGRAFDVSLSGRGTRNLLSPLQDAGLSSLLSRIEGDADWRVTLESPRGDSDDGEAASLRLESDLLGLGLNLPPPLGKPAAEQRALTVETTLGDATRREVHFRYGNALSGIVRLIKPGSASQYMVQAAALRTGGGPVPGLPPNGIRLVGTMAVLSADDWADAWSALRPQSNATGNHQSHTTAVLDNLDIRVQRFGAGERWFDNVRLQVSPAGEGWTAVVDGSDIAGTIGIPRRDSGERWIVDLERLAVPAAAADGSQPAQAPDPRQIPGLIFTCRNFSYANHQLGAVELLTKSHPRGLEIETFVATSDAFTARVSGIWESVQGTQESQFNAELESQDLGRLLSVFGPEAGGAEGGTTSIRMNAAWSGPPSQFSLGSLRGTMSFASVNGRFEDVGGGPAARLFGLLSLQSLRRRLVLDFSDVFDKGFSYDRIQGSFVLESGDAFTSDLFMDGPAARIEITGRADLVEENYDQVVTVMPRLGASLPIAGAVVGGPAGIGVGAALWLADNVLNTRIVDKIGAYKYSVTGDWANPSIEPIQRPRTAEPSDR